MSTTVCLCANSLYAPQSGGHRWVFLNWAMGLRSLGCSVIWLEFDSPEKTLDDVTNCLAILKEHLQPFELDRAVRLYSNFEKRSSDLRYLTPEEALQADLFLNLAYDIPEELVAKFKRSAMVDIDPGLTQMWMHQGEMNVPDHDFYFTIGENVGQPDSPFPDCDLQWHHVPPPIHLSAWPVTKSETSAPYTTVTNWGYHGKRAGFLAYADLPHRLADIPIELAIYSPQHADGEEITMLKQQKWRIKAGSEVASNPTKYRSYIQKSRGEFSCAKPRYVHLQTGWISDRTICYLSSGKPAIVQHTGPSSFLPDAAGLFRFQDLEEAVQYIETAQRDYEQQCRYARQLAEEYFDATKVLGKVLEIALS